MTDLFAEKAQDWDQQSIPARISEGVRRALFTHVEFGPEQTVMDFGAGTGLICTSIAPKVTKVLAVDISASMLEQLSNKVQGQDNVEIYCQDLLQDPLDEQVDIIVSAMAMHHVRDTDALFHAFARQLRSNGQIAVADLDREDGDFHPPGTEGVFHHGFDRDELQCMATAAGFRQVQFHTATTIERDGTSYPIFLMLAQR